MFKILKQSRMKRILTLLLAFTMVIAANAQTHAQRNEAKGAVLGEKKSSYPRTKTDESRTVVLGNNTSSYPRTTASTHEQRSDEENRIHAAHHYHKSKGY